MQQRGWTYALFQRAYEQAAADLAATGDRALQTATVEEQTFRRWTSGRVRSLPNHPAPLILESLLGFPARQLLGPPDATPVTPFGAPVPALNESDILMTARDAAAHAGEAASLSVPDMTLDQLNDDIVRLAQEYSRTAPLDVYRRAQELLHVAQSLLERTQVPRQRTRGYLAAGQAASLLSAITFDLGSLPSAVSLSRTAALYGQVIEHGPLQAYAHGALAFLAFWDGRPAEAVRLINTAKQFGGLGDTARIRLAVIEGRAYGHLGQRELAEHAIQQAIDTSTGTRDELHDDVAGEFGFPEARVAMSNATTHLLLRDSNRAEAEAERALALLNAETDGPILVTTQARVDLARARLIRRELDGAHEALKPVFKVPAQWRGKGTLERLSAMRTELCHPDVVHAQLAAHLGEEIEEFTSAATSRLLGSSAPLVLGN
ncbi:hypothetical protein AB0J21_13875 [Streptomyces sp. NPDC049954]|uniref:hypothetical protein n=1 Tax=Streptomyces sp. NPDC049954 TaxID=3155779 RepID=UPI00342BD8C1